MEIFDRFGDPVCTLKGERSEVGRLAADVERFTRYRGPVTLRPTIWLISGGRIAELTGGDMIEATTALHAPARSQRGHTRRQEDLSERTPKWPCTSQHPVDVVTPF